MALEVLPEIELTVLFIKNKLMDKYIHRTENSEILKNREHIKLKVNLLTQITKESINIVRIVK